MVKVPLCLAAALLIASSPAMAKDYTSKDCPVVGNTDSKIFHVKGDRFYEKMLKQNETGKDIRECFKSQKAARKAGFRRTEK